MMRNVLQLYLLNVVGNVHGEVGHSNRVVPVQESGVNLLFCVFEAAACHICLAHCFYLLEAELIAELIECIVDLIQELKELGSRIAIDKAVKLVNINENDCHFALIF